jgi:hypothetical protein
MFGIWISIYSVLPLGSVEDRWPNDDECFLSPVKLAVFDRPPQIVHPLKRRSSTAPDGIVVAALLLPKNEIPS